MRKTNRRIHEVGQIAQLLFSEEYLGPGGQEKGYPEQGLAEILSAVKKAETEIIRIVTGLNSGDIDGDTALRRLSEKTQPHLQVINMQAETEMVEEGMVREAVGILKDKALTRLKAEKVLGRVISDAETEAIYRAHLVPLEYGPDGKLTLACIRAKAEILNPVFDEVYKGDVRARNRAIKALMDNKVIGIFDSLKSVLGGRRGTIAEVDYLGMLAAESKNYPDIVSSEQKRVVDQMVSGRVDIDKLPDSPVRDALQLLRSAGVEGMVYGGGVRALMGIWVGQRFGCRAH